VKEKGPSLWLLNHEERTSAWHGLRARGRSQTRASLGCEPVHSSDTEDTLGTSSWTLPPAAGPQLLSASCSTSYEALVKLVKMAPSSRLLTCFCIMFQNLDHYQ
ncbi:hypothetical protein STEG23_005291, partial [Scotinomys teguina]